jgi:hypothetical protein
MQLACVDVSFSYLRSAATASFDIKEFHRNCTIISLFLISVISGKVDGWQNRFKISVQVIHEKYYRINPGSLQA